jgi:uncharacterized protein
VRALSPDAGRSRRDLFLEAIAARLFGRWQTRVATRLGLQPRGVRTLEHAVSVAAWPEGTAPLRLAFGSDFHAGPATPERLLDAAAEALARTRPQLLLLGGDYVYRNAARMEALAERLGAVPAPLGRYAVLGNHDWWVGPQPVLSALEAAGIEVLQNRSVNLPAPYEHVSVVGLDDPWLGRPDAEAAFAGAGACRILLVHSPSGLTLTGRRRFDLAVCGHTHGGQIALPGGRPLHLPHGPLCREFPHGRHELETGGTLLVSRGIGSVLLPVRLFAPADILVCTLQG